MSVCTAAKQVISLLLAQFDQNGRARQKPGPYKPPYLDQLLLSVSCVGGRALPLQALVDSGAQNSFLDQELVVQVGCGLEPLPSPYTATVLDGRVIARVSHRTMPVTLITSGNHSETISFLVIPASSTPMVLGYPLLRRHNPQVDWMHGKVASWSCQCHSLCLKSALAPRSEFGHSMLPTGTPRPFWGARPVPQPR